jgi:hydroxymethylglutaryl-CoA reductase
MARVTVSMFTKTAGNLLASVTMAVVSIWTVGVTSVWR